MSEPHNLDNLEVAHEESDVNVRAILGWGLGLAALALVVHVFLWWLIGLYERQAERADTRAYPLAAGQQDVLPPEPRLQTTPQEDMRRLHDTQRARLQGHEWINRDAGIARIPIDDAMRITVERGLPTREADK